MALGLAALQAPSSTWAQALPAVPEPPPPVTGCVGRHGHSGCAARLYAEVLCEIVGERADLNRVQAQLQLRYAQERINFNGIAADQVEAMAVRDYVPRICPPRQEQIRDLLLPQEAG